MKKRLGIITKNDVFFNKARIVLREAATVERIDDASEVPSGKFDLVFTDTESEYAYDPRFITFGEGGDVNLPCTHEEMLGALSRPTGMAKDMPLLYLEGRCAYLRGNRIPLTKTEARLLKILLGARGGIDSHEILNMMNAECLSYNSLKVYINFLRKKLESDGDKIIFSTRIPGGCHYTIHQKYWTVNYADTM